GGSRVFFGVVDAISRKKDVGDADFTVLLERFIGFHCLGVCIENMMGRLKVFLYIVLNAWWVGAFQIAQSTEHNGFVESDPMLDAVTERSETDICVFDESFCCPLIGPAAIFFKCQRQIPMIQ